MAVSSRNVQVVSQFTIARDLGISQASVSQALKGKREQCSAETYAKIWAHALAVGYRGCGIAWDGISPAVGRKPIGVVHGGDALLVRTDPGWGAMLWGLEKFLAKAGIATIPLEAGGYPWSTVRGERARFCPSRLAVATIGAVTVTDLKRLRETPRRVVTMGIAFPDLAPAVEADDLQAADLLLGAIKREGHRAIGWFGGGVAAPIVAAKLRATERAAARHQIALHPVHATLFPLSSREAGRQAARRFLSRSADGTPEQPTAIICSDARVARGALDVCALQGVKVPDELSIVAFDASATRTEESPQITAAGTDPEAIGAAAGELLLHEPPSVTGRARVVRPPARFLAGGTLGAVPSSSFLRLISGARQRVCA